MESGYDAMGKPIPDSRLTAGLSTVREMIPGIATEDAMSLVGKTAHALEQDEPYKAFEVMKETLDLTGSYRLMATLLTA